jgi:uncharacterized protein YndB with AHSA1/START domain
VSASQFNLVTDWRFPAPVEPIWAELMAPEQWPDGWRAVKRVTPIREGDAQGIGAERRFTWRTALPYELSFTMRAVRIEPMHLIEGIARGEIDGVGRWTLSPEGEGTLVRYTWEIALTKPWMRLLSPVLRPAFAWNHHVVMGWGEADLRQRLGIAPAT